MSEPEYDEATCVTAGELRAAGVAVPDTVPDCGWIPRSSMRLEPRACTFDPTTQRLESRIDVTFTIPFRWIAFTVDTQTPTVH